MARARKRGSNPRLSRNISAGGAVKRRQTGGGSFGRQGSGGGRTFSTQPTVYGYNVVKVPRGFSDPQRRRVCKLPLSSDCTRLQMTALWATACFLPSYQILRAVHGDDYHSIVDDLIVEEVPVCHIGGRLTGAEQELQRRIALATAVLMNSEGLPIRYPPDPVFPRPPRTEHITQPWLRALLTGWV